MTGSESLTGRTVMRRAALAVPLLALAAAMAAAQDAVEIKLTALKPGDRV
jgi:hypothetical protein